MSFACSHFNWQQLCVLSRPKQARGTERAFNFYLPPCSTRKVALRHFTLQVLGAIAGGGLVLPPSLSSLALHGEGTSFISCCIRGSRHLGLPTEPLDVSALSKRAVYIAHCFLLNVKSPLSHCARGAHAVRLVSAVVAAAVIVAL